MELDLRIFTQCHPMYVRTLERDWLQPFKLDWKSLFQAHRTVYCNSTSTKKGLYCYNPVAIQCVDLLLQPFSNDNGRNLARNS